ncbi:nucleoside 2-deoxyribosyltransferase [Weissella diestrammenae]|uniref:Nucleoside 2-deoxyribosyltransferase n=1 Tax=Weissella diestrammenae TaxID=1162633 RepID=A0A7G9T670_9LACO|nr:nucleoside 2-deoxyribosyltransferase [Weissella diestrammenae]MCM0583364.1 nucleoside 2-deoxyribosyltransferase [Weissella diestrammenae]QNN75595.1 nucleoside 2-deoxyribosyltransferase [Weissella diestrammenae]
MTQRVYLAGPFFSDAQNERLNKAKALLEQNPTIGYIYEPREHQQAEIVAKFGGNLETAMHEREWQDATYRADVQAMTQADVIVATFDFDIESGNARPDEGTIFEIGYAIAINKPVIILQHQVDDEPLNLMLAASYTGYFWGEKEIEQIKDYDFINLPVHNTDKAVF